MQTLKQKMLSVLRNKVVAAYTGGFIIEGDQCIHAIIELSALPELEADAETIQQKVLKGMDKHLSETIILETCAEVFEENIHRK